MFEKLDPGNTKDNKMRLGVHEFKPSISRRSPNNPKLNNSTLGGARGARQNTGKAVSSGANKPLRAPSNFQTPYEPLKNKVCMVRQQALVVVVSRSRSTGDDSNPNNFRFNIKSSDQFQNSNYFNQAQKKKKNSR
jgi:hypothetical protein